MTPPSAPALLAFALALPLAAPAEEANRYLPLPGLTNCANAAASAFAPDAPAAGPREIGGVPFVLLGGPTNAVDVSSSMRGLAEPFRNKAAFFSARSLKQFGRCALNVPTNQYAALHLVAFSPGRAGHAPRVTVRLGYQGDGHAVMESAVAPVPPAASGAGASGRFHHLVVPLDQSGNLQGLKEFTLEFTRDLRVHVEPPDPNEFGEVPAGPPSDAVILAATLEPSPVTMSVSSAEAGNVFAEPQKAVLRLALANRSGQAVKGRAFARCEGPGTAREALASRRAWKVEAPFDLAAGEAREVLLDATPGCRGWFSCTVGIEAGGRVLQRRDTTFAVLAPDTRKAGEESPFGVWEFWFPHSVAPRADQVEILASLIRKGGWRHTYGGWPVLKHAKESDVPEETFERIKREHKFSWNLWSAPESYQRDAGWYDEAGFSEKVAPLAKRMLGLVEPWFKVLHESRSSTALIRRFSEHLGGEPYAMPEEESRKIEAQMENVRKYCLALKAVDPRVRVVLFNDYPAFVFQYLQRKFPPEAYDVVGLEGAMFLRRPERQPDWLSLLGNLHETRRAFAKLGCSKPIWTTEALYHPTGPGALDLHDQAVIAVREAMLALHLGVQRMAAAGCIKDPADDYQWSNWGTSGFCFRDPDINPKPSYAMYAWLTQVLDQAKPAGHLPPPNPALHALAFERPGGARVVAVWTARGAQRLSLKCPEAPEVRDAYGNLLPSKGGAELAVTATETPLYLVGGRVESIVSAQPVEEPSEAGRPLLDFARAADFASSRERSAVLESSWDTPRIPGAFEESWVTEDGATALRLELKPDADPRKLLPRYAVFPLAKPVVLEGRPAALTARVKGNAGWGRLLFEVVDAKGRVWTSCGNQYEGASNSADPEGASFVNFEGWQTMTVPLPGMVGSPDQSVYRPRNFLWWPTNTPEEKELPARAEQAKADHARALEDHKAALAQYDEKLKKHEAARAAAEAAGKRAPAPPKKPLPPKAPNVRNMGLCAVDYPLTLTKVMVTMRPSILYVDEEKPVARPAICLDRLGVLDEPPPASPKP
jgi:hypothetical protein